MTSNDERALVDAAAEGKVDEVRDLLSQGANPNHAAESKVWRGRRAQPPIALAVAFGHGEVVRLLLEAGASPNQQFAHEEREPEGGEAYFRDHPLASYCEDASGMLECAVRRGDVGLAEALLDAGADPNLAPKTWTPLHFACGLGNAELVELLLRAGADLEAHNAQRNTPFLIAVDVDEVHVLPLLIEAGANVHAVDEEGFGGLALVALGGSVEMAEFLLEAGLDPNRPTEAGATPLMLAAEMDDLGVVRALLRGGADPALRDPEGRTALDIAIATRDAFFEGDEARAALIAHLRSIS